jgi:hypothetical protein
VATRGIRVLIILPLLIGACIGIYWLALYLGGGQLVTAQPDQQVKQILDEMNTGQFATAADHVANTSPALLCAMGKRLVDRYGRAAITNAIIKEWTPYRAKVTSQTLTTNGDSYSITWILVQRGDQWEVVQITRLDDLLR